VTALPLQQREGIATLALLGEHDVPWISAIIDEVEAAVGRSWRELLERIAALPTRAAPARHAAVIAALRHGLHGRQTGSIKASDVRRHLFGNPALDSVSRTERLAAVASALSTTMEHVELAMWADLPAQRIVTIPAGRPDPVAVAADANLSLIQRALMRCYSVRLGITGNARVIAGSAALRGLLMTAHSHGDAVELTISGPLALFHRTTVYGRALGSIAAHLVWCERFVLEAECEVHQQPALLRITQPVLLPPRKVPNRYDSKLEARFAREFCKQAPDWRLLREPTPIDSNGRLAFPDFLIEHREQPDRRWWIEIIGFWTADYVQQKLATYRAARLPNVILCIDASRSVDQCDLPSDARIVRFHKSVPVEAILAIVNQTSRPSTAISWY
jgi:predicted nuclease of restriction endonuclease-like RecB superfamily